MSKIIMVGKKYKVRFKNRTTIVGETVKPSKIKGFVEIGGFDDQQLLISDDDGHLVKGLSLVVVPSHTITRIEEYVDG